MQISKDKMKKIIIVILAFCFTCVKGANFKIYALAFCATSIEQIGTSCQNDSSRFVEQMISIASTLDCKMDMMVYTGDYFDKPHLIKAISDLKCTSNDVVFFYYSGRGVQPSKAPSSVWMPQLCLNYKAFEQEKFVPLPLVNDLLKEKGARLNIILSDCCNTEHDWVSLKLTSESQEEILTDSILCPSPVVLSVDNSYSKDINVKNLEKLFCKIRGSIIAIACKRGQVSYAPLEGGVFSMAFWDELEKVGQKDEPDDWKTLLEKTKLKTLEVTDNKQEPFFQIM